MKPSNFEQMRDAAWDLQMKGYVRIGSKYRPATEHAQEGIDEVVTLTFKGKECYGTIEEAFKQYGVILSTLS